MKEESRCVSIGGGALSVVMDGHKPTLKWSVMTLDMIMVSKCIYLSCAYIYIFLSIISLGLRDVPIQCPIYPQVKL